VTDAKTQVKKGKGLSFMLMIQISKFFEKGLAIFRYCLRVKVIPEMKTWVTI